MEIMRIMVTKIIKLLVLMRMYLGGHCPLGRWVACGDLCPCDDEHDNHGQCHDDHDGHEDHDHDDQAPGRKL